MRRVVCILWLVVGLGAGSLLTPTSATATPTTATATPTTATATPTTATARAGGAETTVARVVDGDTIRIEDGTLVRLIGIDTPEASGPYRDEECFGREASRRTEALLPPGAEVRLVFDVERRDRYDRLLAYVYRVRDGLFVNANLVRDGYANALTVPPNVRHAERFRRFQREAREAGRGLWSAC